VSLCLTNGLHSPGSSWAKECPLRSGDALDQRRKAAQASADARRRRAPVQESGPETSGNGTASLGPA